MISVNRSLNNSKQIVNLIWPSLALWDVYRCASRAGVSDDRWGSLNSFKGISKNKNNNILNYIYQQFIKIVWKQIYL